MKHSIFTSKWECTNSRRILLQCAESPNADCRKQKKTKTAPYGNSLLLLHSNSTSIKVNMSRQAKNEAMF